MLLGDRARYKLGLAALALSLIIILTRIALISAGAPNTAERSINVLAVVE
jgi:hypothetical protein